MPGTSYQIPQARRERLLRSVAVAESDLDGARLGEFLFGELNGKDAVGEIGGDLFGIDGIGNGEAAGEGAVGALHDVKAFLFLGLLEFALAFNGEGAVFEVDVDIFELDLGEVGLDDEFRLVFDDAQGRSEAVCCRNWLTTSSKPRKAGKKGSRERGWNLVTDMGKPPGFFL
jgi:hypothetical protein